MKGKKRVLIITYYWPPAGGISVLRSLKIAKYLRQFGWEPIIHTLENPDYPILDDSNNKHIPEGIEILKTPAFEPFTLFKKLTGRSKKDPLVNVLNTHDNKPGLLHNLSVWLRANYFIPDARSLWIKPSVKNILNYIDSNPVDAIFTDGPPHTNTRIATIIKQKTGIPWLMDFQDPWTQVDYYKLFPIGKKADVLHKKMEQEAFEEASLTTIVSPTWKQDLESIGARNVHVIPWGFDPEDYEGLSIQSKDSDKIVISHVGHLGSDRYLGGLIKALSELKSKSADVSKFQFKFAGSVDRAFINDVQNHGLSELFQFVGQIGRREALELTLSSDVLLLPLNKAENVQGRIPGKLFEYIYSKNMIWVFGPEKTDVNQIIKETRTGFSTQYDDVLEIQRYLDLFLKDVGNTRVQPTDIEKYSVVHLTQKIASYLDSIKL